jgi:hypothetical protein
MTDHHEWVCGPCDMPWSSWDHQTALRAINGRNWRGNPGQLVPYRQWIRENLPSGRNGFVLCGDDGFLRLYSAGDQTGYVFPLEVKSNGSTLDHATRSTFEALAKGRLCPALVLYLSPGANVPGPLQHWPNSCPHCYLPGALVVADKMWLNNLQVNSSAELAQMLSHPFETLSHTLEVSR